MSSNEQTAETAQPHEFEGSGGVCHLCGRWDLNSIHEVAVSPPGQQRHAD